MSIHISMSAMKDCINSDSYGCICVGCNACGKIDKEKQKESALELYKRKLEEEYKFDRWHEGFEELQRKNVASNIEYFKEKIAELEKGDIGA